MKEVKHKYKAANVALISAPVPLCAAGQVPSVTDPSCRVVLTVTVLCQTRTRQGRSQTFLSLLTFLVGPVLDNLRHLPSETVQARDNGIENWFAWPLSVSGQVSRHCSSC